jgi:hypothetical protein
LQEEELHLQLVVKEVVMMVEVQQLLQVVVLMMVQADCLQWEDSTHLVESDEGVQEAVAQLAC